MSRKNVQLPEQLKNEGLFQGESYHLQESGVLIINKKKQKKMLEYLGKIHSDKVISFQNRAQIENFKTILNNDYPH